MKTALSSKESTASKLPKIKSKTIKISVEAKAVLPYNQLLPFQDELKSISKDNYEKLRNNIIKYGFSFAIHVWKHKNKNYIIDGHQRLFTVKQLHEIEGYKIPALPVAFVEAKTFEEAKIKVLSGASVYGSVNDTNLFNFMREYNIPFTELTSNFQLPNVDMDLFNEHFMKAEEIPLPVEKMPNGDVRASSDGVRQVVLFFDAKTHDKFVKIVDSLMPYYKKENVTDTVMEALLEVHSRRKAQ